MPNTAEDQRSVASELGADRIGNLDIRITGSRREEGVTKYEILVNGPQGSTKILRRYKDFEELHAQLFGEEVGTSEAQASTMPPKSFWRKNFSGKFNADRQRRLGEVASAALMHNSDAEVEDCPPALRKFLGLDEVIGEAAPTAQPAEGAQRSLPSDATPAPQETQAKTEEHKGFLQRIEGEVEDAIHKVAEAVHHKNTSEAASSAQSTQSTPAEPQPEPAVKEDNFLQNALHAFEHKAEAVAKEVEQAVGIVQEKKKDPVPEIYKVMPDGTKKPGLFYRTQKIIDDDVAKQMNHLTNRYQPWNTCVVGTDTGDGFIRIDLGGSSNGKAKMHYLPIRHEGDTRIFKAEEPTEAWYQLHDTHLNCEQAKCMGLMYRNSKNMTDHATGDNRTQAWETVVLGEDQKDGWLKVKGRFLPMTIGGCAVISLKRSKDAPRKSSNLACLAVCCSR